MPLKVIGAGFGRTGTTSLKSALEQLGFEPSYHMAEVVGERPGVNDGHLNAWHAFLCRGVVPDWRRMFVGYHACTDAPTCVFYRELMDAFPDARVVLTVRDPASWYASVTALREMTSKLLGRPTTRGCRSSANSWARSNEKRSAIRTVAKKR